MPLPLDLRGQPVIGQDTMTAAQRLSNVPPPPQGPTNLRTATPGPSQLPATIGQDAMTAQQRLSRVPSPASVSGVPSDGVTAAQRIRPTAPSPLTTPGSGLRDVPGLGSKLRGIVNGAAGKLMTGVSVAQSINDSTKEDSTARYAQRFGVDEPTGDGSIGDIAKFAGLRAGGFATDLANNLTMGLAGKLYRDNGTQPTTPAGGTAASAAPGAAPALTDAATPSDNPMEVNNAERFGVPIAAQRNAVAMSPVDLRGGFANENLTTNTGQANANMRASVAGIPQGEQALVAGLDAGTRIYAGRDPQGGLTLTGTGDGSADAAYRASAQYKDGVARAAGERAQLDAIEARNNEQGLRDAVMNSSIGNLKANRQNLANFEAQKTLDKTLGSQQTIAAASRQLEAMKMLQTQQNSDREFGRATGNDNFTHQQTAMKDLSGRYEKMFTTTDKDGKPIVDQARVAKYTEGIQNFLGNRQAQLEAAVASGKASPKDVEALNLIKTKGVAALDEKDKAHIESLIKTGERSGQQHNLLLGNRHVASTNPEDYQVMKREQNLFGSDTLTMRGGGTIREADLRYTEPGNIILPNTLKQRTTDFDLAKQGLRQ